jgi:predicted permease
MTRWLQRLTRRIRALVHGAALDQELSEEIQLHVRLETEDLIRTQRLDPAEARRQALLAFGGVERYREAQHDARGVRWIEDSLRDLGLAVRVLLRSPGYTVPAVLVLGLGIGATTAVFSGVDTVLGRLPYPKDEQLVRIYEQNSPTNRWTLSVADFQAIAGGAHTLSAVGAARFRRVPVSAGGEPQSIQAGVVTSGFARVLGVRPAFGRSLEPADDALGAPLVVVVSDAFARRVLGGAAGALGQSIMIDGRAHTVVGVWPRGLDRLSGIRADVWPALQFTPPTRRGPFGLFVIGRLADGVTLDAVRRELADVSQRLLTQWTSDFQDRNARLTPYSLREVILGDGARTMGVFVAAVLLVLLIAVANVASLTLVRATGRWRELSLRAALGATRVRLVRLVMIESITLAAAGAAVGLGLGAAGLRLLIAIGPFVPRLDGARLDARAVAFAILVSLVAGIVVGAYPLLLLLRHDPGASLSGGARTVGEGPRSHALRGAFVIGEFALALPLLAVTGLLLNSFLRLQRVPPGFDGERVTTVNVSLPAGRYPDDSALANFWNRLLPTIEQSGNVAAIGLGDALPPIAQQTFNQNNFDLVDHPVGEGASQPVSDWITVTRGYFATLKIPLLDGRLFTPGDTGNAPPVVLVSRTWANHYFPGEQAIGRQLIEGGCNECPRTTIVGVVGDVRYDGLHAPGEAMYAPMEEGNWGRNVHLFVRGQGPGSDALATVRAAVLAADPGVSLDRVQTMADVVGESITAPRHLVTLLAGFAVAAVALAAIGIFGLLSYTVAARHREIGVRMALGADQRAVVRMIVGGGLWYAGIGAAVGLIIALVGTRLLAETLFGVSPTDPATFVAVTLAMLGVALIACWLPARRAAATDPVRALRSDN